MQGSLGTANGKWDMVGQTAWGGLPRAGLPLQLTILTSHQDGDAVAYVGALRFHKVHTLEWVPLWCLLPVVLGLSYHVLLMIALTGEGRGTSGYYLLFMVPVMGTAVGLGFLTFWHKALFRITATLLGMDAVCFAVVISWAQFMLYSGILSASENNKFYRMPDTFPPYFGIPDAIAKLSVLAYPQIGIICWSASV